MGKLIERVRSRQKIAILNEFERWRVDSHLQMIEQNRLDQVAHGKRRQELIAEYGVGNVQDMGLGGFFIHEKQPNHPWWMFWK